MKKILIVEDNYFDRLLLTEWLRRIFNSSDSELIETESGKEALEYLSNNGEINLLLVDIRMPGMSGFEFMRKYRESGGEAIAIATTAMALGHDENTWNDFQGVLFKPLSKGVLEKTIKSLF